ncbi:DcaP family trimeric outer membrane transporter [Maribellus mangrovi]|uniref:DcaP family trimeric outer membrane transporter n=1 Tax=Maribellus mangrovi TaxID=3133146 RepID=UPI0030EC1C6B
MKIKLFWIFIVYFFPMIVFAQQADSLVVDSLNISQKIFPMGDVKETSQVLSANDLVESDFPGSWPMFGSDIRMKIGGYVKVDAIYDVDGTNDRTQFLMSTIPVEGQPEHDYHGYFSFLSKETRFNIDIRRIGEGKVPLKLFIEGDFWSEGSRFRLRHAYITAGDFIIGQTWTTLSILESLPFMIDFAAGDALFGGRTTQIRFQKQFEGKLKLAMAVESLDLMGIENPGDLPGKPSAQLPLFAARLDYNWKSGLLVLGSSAGQLRWDKGADGTTQALQIAGVIAGRQYIGKKNYLTWNVSAGYGSGENIMAFAGSNANAVITPEGKLETIPSFAMVLGFMHKWTETLSSNFSYAYGWLDTPESRADYAIKRGGIGHVNVIFRPYKRFSTGMEYIWGAQRTTNDALGSANRIQAMAKFEF